MNRTIITVTLTVSGAVILAGVALWLKSRRKK
jgi:LPXTG-motif cell wall-anchored protein